MWNATASLVAGGLVFAGCYGAGWLAGRKDPAMLAVLRSSARHPARGSIDRGIVWQTVRLQGARYR